MSVYWRAHRSNLSNFHEFGERVCVRAGKVHEFHLCANHLFCLAHKVNGLAENDGGHRIPFGFTS